jgi:hypothetical protein
MKFDKMEQENEALNIATMQANRCKYPPKLEDCPVIQFLKATSKCTACNKEEKE